MPTVRAMTSPTAPSLFSAMAFAVALHIGSMTVWAVFLSMKLLSPEFSTNNAISKNNLQTFQQHQMTFKPAMTFF